MAGLVPDIVALPSPVAHVVVTFVVSTFTAMSCSPAVLIIATLAVQGAGIRACRIVRIVSAVSVSSAAVVVLAVAVRAKPARSAFFARSVSGLMAAVPVSSRT